MYMIVTCMTPSSDRATIRLPSNKPTVSSIGTPFPLLFYYKCIMCNQMPTLGLCFHLAPKRHQQHHGQLSNIIKSLIHVSLAPFSQSLAPAPTDRYKPSQIIQAQKVDMITLSQSFPTTTTPSATFDFGWRNSLCSRPDFHPHYSIRLSIRPPHTCTSHFRGVHSSHPSSRFTRRQRTMCWIWN